MRNIKCVDLEQNNISPKSWKWSEKKTFGFHSGHGICQVLRSQEKHIWNQWGKIIFHSYTCNFELFQKIHWTFLCYCLTSNNTSEMNLKYGQFSMWKAWPVCLFIYDGHNKSRSRVLSIGSQNVVSNIKNIKYVRHKSKAFLNIWLQTKKFAIQRD